MDIIVICKKKDCIHNGGLTVDFGGGEIDCCNHSMTGIEIQCSRGTKGQALSHCNKYERKEKK